MIEQGLSHQPAGEAGELRAIKNLGLYRSDAEREFVQKRAAELRSHWHRPRGLKRRRRRPSSVIGGKADMARRGRVANWIPM